MNNRFYSDYIVYLSDISVNDENDFKRQDALTKSVKDNMCNTSVKDFLDNYLPLRRLPLHYYTDLQAIIKRKKREKQCYKSSN